jgi:hypothetical protein
MPYGLLWKQGIKECLLVRSFLCMRVYPPPNFTISEVGMKCHITSACVAVFILFETVNYNEYRFFDWKA